MALSQLAVSDPDAFASSMGRVVAAMPPGEVVHVTASVAAKVVELRDALGGEVLVLRVVGKGVVVGVDDCCAAVVAVINVHVVGMMIMKST